MTELYLSRADFIAWLKLQPAKRQANTKDQCACPMASYAIEQLGWDVAFASYTKIFHCDSWKDMHQANKIELSDFSFASFCDCTTYGQIVKILELVKS